MPRNILKIDRDSPGNEGKHYRGKYQPIDFIESWNLGFPEGSILKYLCRHRSKNGREDIAKAHWYCSVLRERYMTGRFKNRERRGDLDVLDFLDAQDLDIKEKNAIFNLVTFLETGDSDCLKVVESEISKILEWYDHTDKATDAYFAGVGRDLIEPEKLEPSRKLIEDQIFEAKPSPRGYPEPRWFSLDAERPSRTVKFKLGDTEGYFTVGMFSDGTPGEVFVDVGKEGSTVSGLVDCWAIAISMLLRYGIDPRKIYEKFSYQDFEPGGFSGNDVVPMAKSIVDFIVRYMKAVFPPTADPRQVHDDYSKMIEVAPK